MLASIDQKLLWARCSCTARDVKRLPMLATGRRAPTSCSSSPTTMLDFIVAFYSRCTRGYKWLCSACIHGTTMRNTTGERVHIAACAARQKNRPSFGHFSTCESSMEASLGVSEAPKSVVGTWYARRGFTFSKSPYPPY